MDKLLYVEKKKQYKVKVRYGWVTVSLTVNKVYDSMTLIHYLVIICIVMYTNRFARLTLFLLFQR